MKSLTKPSEICMQISDRLFLGTSTGARPTERERGFTTMRTASSANRSTAVSSKIGMPILQDLRYTLRTIRQAPGFSVVVTLTIALGVGATTAIFSVVDAVLLRPLPYPDQGSLVQLFDVDVNNGRHNGVLSLPEFTDWRDRGRDVFES